MKQYLQLVEDVYKNGVYKEDRTGTGTISVFGYQSRYDLRKGFPLLTTKKIHFKSVVHELLWFLSGDTNVKYLQDKGVKIWDSWRRPYTLDRELVLVTPIEKTYVPYEGDYSRGSATYSEGSIEHKLSSSWRKMLQRCYDPSSHNYSLYGGSGASVCKRWHTLENFIEDVQKLPHWHYKLNNWNSFELDKDYYGSGQYGPDTSVWLRTDENNKYTKVSRPIVISSQENDSKVFLTLNDAAKGIGMPSASLHRWLKDGVPSCIKGKNKVYRGWEFREEDLEGKLLRLELIDSGDMGRIYQAQWRDFGGIDQIQQVVDQIKNNPDSRRIIVSAWNPVELEDMALPPCHAFFQFYVVNGELSCQLYQRSADIFLGVPFNIASYALLTHMIAQVCDLKVGEFIHTLGDAHIYTNHLDQLSEQLNREPKALPKLVLNPEVKNIFDFKYEDINLEGYDPHPLIKGAVAV